MMQLCKYSYESRNNYKKDIHKEKSTVLQFTIFQKKHQLARNMAQLLILLSKEKMMNFLLRAGDNSLLNT